VISTTFGVGDGSTTFNLPNYTNRVPYGATLAATGGSADAVVVSHTHTATVTDPGHIHVQGGNGGLCPGGGSQEPLGPNASVYGFTTQSAVTNISVTNVSAGVSGTNANLPPYLGINFIIKT
jgi:microcystin-dependent protein